MLNPSPLSPPKRFGQKEILTCRQGVCDPDGVFGPFSLPVQFNAGCAGAAAGGLIAGAICCCTSGPCCCCSHGVALALNWGLAGVASGLTAASYAVSYCYNALQVDADLIRWLDTQRPCDATYDDPRLTVPHLPLDKEVWAAVAADQGDVLCRLAAAPDFDPNARDPAGKTLLWVAAALGKSAAVAALLGASADCYQTCQSSVGELSPLEAAALEGHSEAVQILLRHDPDTVSAQAVHLAVARGHGYLVQEVLIKDRSDLQAVAAAATVLYPTKPLLDWLNVYNPAYLAPEQVLLHLNQAVLANAPQRVAAFLDFAEADVNAPLLYQDRRPTSMSLLDAALRLKHEDAARILIERGATCTHAGFIVAAKRGHSRELLEPMCARLTNATFKQADLAELIECEALDALDLVLRAGLTEANVSWDALFLQAARQRLNDVANALNAQGRNEHDRRDTYMQCALTARRKTSDPA